MFHGIQVAGIFFTTELSNKADIFGVNIGEEQGYLPPILGQYDGYVASSEAKTAANIVAIISERGSDVGAAYGVPVFVSADDTWWLRGWLIMHPTIVEEGQNNLYGVGIGMAIP